jgi:hypothetical protein
MKLRLQKKVRYAYFGCRHVPDPGTLGFISFVEIVPARNRIHFVVMHFLKSDSVSMSNKSDVRWYISLEQYLNPNVPGDMVRIVTQFITV